MERGMPRRRRRRNLRFRLTGTVHARQRSSARSAAASGPWKPPPRGRSERGFRERRSDVFVPEGEEAVDVVTDGHDGDPAEARVTTGTTASTYRFGSGP